MASLPTLADMDYVNRKFSCLGVSGWLRALSVLFACLALPCALTAEHIPGLYNTGVGGSHYRIVSPSDMPANGPVCISYVSGRHSAPIGVPFGAIGPAGYPQLGNYVFRTEFVVSGLNTNTARLRGLWRTYRPAQMLLNGLPVAAYTGYNDRLLNPFLPFVVSTGFIEGTNLLDFVVTNSNSDGECVILDVDSLQGTALPSGTGYRAIPDLRDTGTLPGGALAPVRGPDCAYTLISAPAGIPGGPSRVKVESCGGYANSPYAQWIGPNDDPCSYKAPIGLYRYRQTFNLTGLDPATAKLDGWCASDGDVQVRVNGVLATNIGHSYDKRVYFAVTNGFAAGLNNLDFVVDNTWAVTYQSYGPAALFVEGLQGSAKLDPNSPRLGIRVSQLELAWDSATNVTYQVQNRSSLTNDEWVNYGPPVAGVDGVIRISAPVVGDRSFYRLVTVP